MVIYKYTEDKLKKRRDDVCCKLRDKLNKSIENGEDYSVIYQLSIELDELIAQYYAKNNKKKLLWMVT